MLNDAPSSQDDFDSPIRDVDEFQYVNADDDSPFAVTMDGLIGLVYKVAAQYRANASWVMNSNTASVIRKLKASTAVITSGSHCLNLIKTTSGRVAGEDSDPFPSRN